MRPLMKRTRSADSRNRRGFTLLELMLVMAILVMLASLGTVFVLRMQGSAKADATRSQIATLAQQCKAYRMDVGRFPSSLNDLYVAPAGLSPQKWRGPYMEGAAAQDTLDQWGNPFTYQADETNIRVVITSNGPDLAAGGGDDVTNAPMVQ